MTSIRTLYENGAFRSDNFIALYATLSKSRIDRRDHRVTKNFSYQFECDLENVDCL